MNKFDFISEVTLRTNLVQAARYLNALSSVSISPQYKEDILFISSLRKTIIIHVAAIVEALLLWELKQVLRTTKVKLLNEWKYKDMNVLYTISTSEQIVAGRRLIEKKDIEKLDFLRVIQLCDKYKIIQSKKLLEDVQALRELRNKLHIGGLKEIEKEYQNSDLEFCFLVLEHILQLVAKGGD